MQFRKLLHITLRERKNRIIPRKPKTTVFPNYPAPHPSCQTSRIQKQNSIAITHSHSGAHTHTPTGNPQALGNKKSLSHASPSPESKIQAFATNLPRQHRNLSHIRLVFRWLAGAAAGGPARLIKRARAERVESLRLDLYIPARRWWPDKADRDTRSALRSSCCCELGWTGIVKNGGARSGNCLGPGRGK